VNGRRLIEYEVSYSPMTLSLHDLRSMHPKLTGHPTDFSRFGALALQRAGHASPAPIGIDHDGVENRADIAWLTQDPILLEALDGKRVTEEGAEAVALVYANATAGWVVKRRLQQTEGADWLLNKEKRWLALEVSGTAVGDSFARL
jgi:hypothetical protein